MTTLPPTLLDRYRPEAGDSLPELYRHLVRIRRFEEKIRDLRASQDVLGSVHLCIGQEAIYVGACAALKDQDPVFATYRGHGWAIAAGVPLRNLFAELLGRATGVNEGRGGSAYFSAAEYGFFGENSIVGAGAPIALGAAVATRHQQDNRVAVVAFGEGAMNQGAVHEAMNFASAFDLPVIFVVENNLYSELTPIADMVKVDKLFRRASAYGMPGVRVDGNDVIKMRDTVAAAADRARSGQGPVLIEAMTERLVGHYIGDAEHYRPPGEVEEAQLREPLVVTRDHIISSGIPESEVDAIDAEVDTEVSEAAEIALNDPLAEANHAKEHVYA